MQTQFCKSNAKSSFEYNSIILVSVSSQVRFPITFDQSSVFEYISFEKNNYFSWSFQLLVGNF